MVAFQDAGFAEQPGAAGVFLPGLKDEQHIVRQSLIGRSQAEGQPQQHRHMAVMSAGVHVSLMPAAVRRIAALGDRQGIHVAAKGDGLLTAVVEECRDPAFEREIELTGEILQL